MSVRVGEVMIVQGGRVFVAAASVAVGVGVGVGVEEGRRTPWMLARNDFETFRRGWMKGLSLLP